ncbi:MAG TPA: type I 3-dehydroquinate dehydratase [Dehalococcoidales bacterium]|nr:type I 3-dehydroquinate dehydratase [Dehalococcoidales bacterium]
MNRPRICAVIVNKDPEAIRAVEPLVELFEVRIDLIGDGWSELVKQLNQPWIACNRSAGEGGKWRGEEAERIGELIKAVELGADIIDIELATRDLAKTVSLIKEKAKCLLSFHEFNRTPPLSKMREIVQQELDAGADICKVVTTAQRPADNLAVLQLVADFPRTRVVSLAMGPSGLTSRILCPLVGGDFTYASMEKGKESASGQITVTELRKLYDMVQE